MPVTIDFGIAKTHKFASRESGDTAEVVERPGGGVSTVIVDGQGSGAAAKRLSLLVAGRVVSLLNDGVRDGAAARAAHDFLFAQRSGQVSAALDIVSIDLATSSVLFTRNSEVPMLLFRDGDIAFVEDSGGRIGIYRHTRPRVLEFPLTPGVMAVIVTDGVVGAGARSGSKIDLVALARSTVGVDMPVEVVADSILRAAMAADDNRPRDDMTVVVVKLGPGVQEQPVRRLSVSVPLPE